MISHTLRAEASELADHRAPEIYLRAMDIRERSRGQSRFYKLRKRLTGPVNQREEDYVSALGMYVYHKLSQRKFMFSRPDIRQALVYHSIRETMWRNLMQTIEDGFAYTMPTNQTLAYVDQGYTKIHHFS